MNSKNDSVRTPLIITALNAHNDFTAMLIENAAQVNDIDNDDHSALYYAAENGYTEIVGQLIMVGAEN